MCRGVDWISQPTPVTTRSMTTGGVDLEVEAGAEISGDDPGEVLLDPRIFSGASCVNSRTAQGRPGKRAGGTDGDRVDELVRPLSAE